MTTTELYKRAATQLPIVAILRGLEPNNAEAVGATLIQSGFTMIEVPMNSPNPLASIQILAKQFGNDALIGAGTVLTVEQVQQVQEVGGKLIVSPNTNPAVIKATKAADMISMPGFRTTTEAFAALDAGADALKLFPCDDCNPKTLTAIKTVLPKLTRIYGVGGIDHTQLKLWLDAGAYGFGMGSALFKPNLKREQIAANAAMLVNAFRQVHVDRNK